MAANVHISHKPGKPRRDPVQRQQGALYLHTQRNPPPGAWTDNRLAQSQHYTGTIFLALSAVQEAMAGASVWSERRKRRDRTTFGPKGETAVVKGVSPDGGAGNDEDYAPEHSSMISEILNRPNETETFPAMLAYGTLQWGLTGNAPFWLVPGAGHGRPVELYPLVESLLQQAVGPSEFYPEGAWRVTPYYPGGTGWAYGQLAGRLAASSALLPGQEVRKLKAPHPLTRSDGYSPLSGCAVQFDIMESIDISRHSAFQQGAQTGTLVYIPGLGEDGTERVASQFREKYAGPRNARKVGVVSSPPGSTGEFKVDRDPPPREMDYTSSWEQAVRVVLAAFGQHAAVAGLKDVVGYAEFYAAQMQVYYRLSGLARRWGDFWTTYLARPWCKKPGEYRVKVQIPKPRNEEAYQQQLMALGQAGGAMVNEVRAALDLKPVRCGDLPLQLYLRKVEEIEFPQAQPMAPGAEPQPGEAAPQEPPAAPDDSPEGAQDATVQAALGALGVPAEDGGDEQPDGVQKGIRSQFQQFGGELKQAWSATKQAVSSVRGAVAGKGGTGTRHTRAEGERWQGAGGQWYTKRSGQIVETAAPGTARPSSTPTVQPTATGRSSAAPDAGKTLAPSSVAVSKPGAKPATPGPGQPGFSGSKHEQPIPAGHPPLKPGHVRLYHGGDAGSTGTGGGRWITGHKEDAEGWAARNSGMKVHYVDVPRNHPAIRDGLQEVEHSTGTKNAKYLRQELPEELAKQLRPIPETAPAVAAANPAAKPAGRYPSRHSPGVTYGNPADRDADDRAIDNEVRAAHAEVAKIKDQLAAKKTPGAYIDALRSRLAAAENRAKKTRARADALRAGAGAPGTAPASPAAPSAGAGVMPRDKLHRAIATSAGAKKFGLTPQVLARMPEAAVRSIGKQLGIEGAEHESGGHYAEAAKAVPAHPVLSAAHQWAAGHAEKHADRVAAHFGIPREHAVKLLTDAIRRVAEHAAANGGAMPASVSIRNKRTGQSATLTPTPAKRGGPTSGAPPRPTNPGAKGSLPPRPGRVGKAVNRRVRALAGRVLAALEQE